MATATLTRGDGYWIQDGSLYTSLASDKNADWGHYIGQYRQDYWNEKEYAAGCVAYSVPSISDGLLGRTISLPCAFTNKLGLGKFYAVLSTTAPSGLEWRFGPKSGVISNEGAFSYTDTSLTFSLIDGVGVSKKTIYLYLYQKNTGYGTNGPRQAATTTSFNNGSISYAGAYKLSTSEDSGSTIIVNRTASGSGLTGVIENGATLYYGDKLKISFSPKSNYRIVSSLVNGSSFTSGNTHNVTGNVSIEATSQALSSGIMATDANIESVSTITINSNSNSYLHTLEYDFNGLTGTIASKTNKTSIAWTIPSSFYDGIPNAKTGTCVITCNTLDGSGALLGVDECRITVTAAYDKCKPNVSGSVLDTNQASVNITGNNEVLIRFLSNALCKIDASGVGGATIQKMSINGSVLGSGETEMTISSVEATTFVFSATDSRGYISEVTIEPEVVPYVKLTINPVFSRPSVTSGEIFLSFDGNFYNGSICDINNELSIKYRYRKIDDSAYGSWITIAKSSYSTGTLTYRTTSPIAISDNAGSTTSFGYKDNYEFQVQATDGDGSTVLSSVLLTIPVLNGQPVYDWGQNDFSFNVPVYMNGNLLKGLGAPSESGDAVSLGYAKRNVSITTSKNFTIGDTFTVSESLVGKNPVIAMLAWSETLGHVTGSAGDRSISFHSVTDVSNGLYVNFATFSVSDDGLVLTLSDTKRLRLTTSGINIETGVSLHFGGITLIA